MGSLPTYNAAPSATINAADLNSLFTGVGSATSQLNASNVRSQSIDLGQIDPSPAQNSGRVTRYASQDNVTSSATHASTASRVVATITLGTTMQIRSGDVWRCYYSLRLTDQNSSVTNVADLNSMVRRPGAGWIFWLMWDIGGSGTYSNIPGQDDFSTSHYSGVNDHAGSAIPHMRTNQTLTSMVFPHVGVVPSIDSSGNPDTNAHQYVGTSGLGSPLNRPVRRSRSFHYKRPAGLTTLNVYGFRIMTRGVVSLGRDPGGSGGGLLFVRDTPMYSTDPSFGGANDTITVDNARLINLVQAEK
jgi:hypothetical protein